MARHRSRGIYAIATLVLYIDGAHAQGPDGPGSNGQDESCPRVGEERVRGNLQIAAPCELTGTEVRGDVILYAGGSLIARQVRIRGSLDGSRADFVVMDRSRVDGDLRLAELVGDLSNIQRTEIRGSVLLQGNRSRLEILNNDVGRGMQVLGNTGGVLIAGNSFDGDLECAANTPMPLGVGNRVQGEQAGQCENLLAEAPQSVPTPTPTPTPTPSPEPSPPQIPPPPATPPATGGPVNTFVPDPEGGGGGAMGWPAALLLPLLVWRRFSRG
jgi:hypothetical protein